MDKHEDPYEILGVPYDATESEIKKAYRKAALQHHPDRQTTEEEKLRSHDVFSKISDAYIILTDPVKRYDWKLANDQKLTNGRASKVSTPKTKSNQQPVTTTRTKQTPTKQTPLSSSSSHSSGHVSQKRTSSQDFNHNSPRRAASLNSPGHHRSYCSFGRSSQSPGTRNRQSAPSVSPHGGSTASRRLSGRMGRNQENDIKANSFQSPTTTSRSRPHTRSSSCDHRSHRTPTTQQTQQQQPKRSSLPPPKERLLGFGMMRRTSGTKKDDSTHTQNPNQPPPPPPPPQVRRGRKSDFDDDYCRSSSVCSANTSRTSRTSISSQPKPQPSLTRAASLSSFHRKSAPAAVCKSMDTKKKMSHTSHEESASEDFTLGSVSMHGPSLSKTKSAGVFWFRKKPQESPKQQQQPAHAPPSEAPLMKSKTASSSSNIPGIKKTKSIAKTSPGGISKNLVPATTTADVSATIKTMKKKKEVEETKPIIVKHAPSGGVKKNLAPTITLSDISTKPKKKKEVVESKPTIVKHAPVGRVNKDLVPTATTVDKSTTPMKKTKQKKEVAETKPIVVKHAPVGGEKKYLIPTKTIASVSTPTKKTRKKTHDEEAKPIEKNGFGGVDKNLILANSTSDSSTPIKKKKKKKEVDETKQIKKKTKKNKAATITVDCSTSTDSTGSSPTTSLASLLFPSSVPKKRSSHSSSGTADTSSSFSPDRSPVASDGIQAGSILK